MQASGLSATHEEYREARESRPVLVLHPSGVNPEPQQLDFIREVQGWKHGHCTATCSDADGLRDRITRAFARCHAQPRDDWHGARFDRPLGRCRGCRKLNSLAAVSRRADR